MKIITNKFIPFKGFGAMNILGLIFTRKQESEITLRTKRHEQVHTYQQYELLMVGALVSLVLCNIFASWWYLLFVALIPFSFYLVGFILEIVVPPYHNAKLLWKERKYMECLKKIWMDAYSDNCFEREAYMNDKDPNYLATRSLFSWSGYIIPKSERKAE